MDTYNYVEHWEKNEDLVLEELEDINVKSRRVIFSKVSTV